MGLSFQGSSLSEVQYDGLTEVSLEREGPKLRISMGLSCRPDNLTGVAGFPCRPLSRAAFIGSHYFFDRLQGRPLP